MTFRMRYKFVAVLAVQLLLVVVYIMMRWNSTAVTDMVQSPGTRDTIPQDIVTLVATNFIRVNDATKADVAGNVTSNGPPPVKPEAFQPIDNKAAWLYSAFYDHVAAQSGKPLVRVFGVIRKTFIVKVFCSFSSNGTNLSSTGQVIEFPGHFGRLDRPAFLECNLPTSARPTHVSVSFQAKETPTNRLQILYPGPRIRNFTVCYSVLHSGFNQTTQIIENIEMNRILGAEHFMIYNYSISPEVDQILRRYQEDGLVTVLPWPIPTLESHYYSQLSSLNDCSYRNRNTSRFVVVVDTDELIVPRNHLTWMSFIDTVSPNEVDVSQFRNSSKPANKGNKLTGCFMVRSSYFPFNQSPNLDSLPFQFDEEEKTNIIKHKIQTLSQLTRMNRIFPYHDRCKYIARPEHVYISGIHYVMAFVGSNDCLKVHENTALIHHYRLPAVITKKEQINDTSILRFKQSLYPRIMENIRRFPNIFT